MNYEFSQAFAETADQNDPLRSFREEFLFPTCTSESPIYFVGNSLGLQPKRCASYLEKELQAWHHFGVEAHFHAEKPWFSYHEGVSEKAATLVGAKKEEVVNTHSLTTNLHLLMVSFYRPKGKRTKILCEGKAFPSDRYALETQLAFHGQSIEKDLVEIFPREGEYTLRMVDVKDKIAELGDELALVLIGGVNYYTGQLMDMASITQWGHQVGAIVGFDLAHAAGNVELKLHDWQVDFAAWCSYKYLNSSPGGVSGLFVHQKHLKDNTLPRFAGWWGHDKKTRFLMEPGFQPIPTAEAWQLSNAPILGMAAHEASLDVFLEAGFQNLRKKSVLLTGYLRYLLEEILTEKPNSFTIITPKDPTECGAQISLLLKERGKETYDSLTSRGLMADWREPNVIRVAPVPLYNSFTDVYRFAKLLRDSI